MLKIDDLARNVDRISLEIDSLKIRSIPPKHDINESLKSMRISIDECKERIARIRAKREWPEKVFSRDDIDEDLKVIGVTPIESLFSSINLGKYGTVNLEKDESTLAKRHPNDSEFIDLSDKIDKSGMEEVKT